MNNVQTTPSILTEIGDQLIRGVDYRIETRNYDYHRRVISRTRLSENTVEKNILHNKEITLYLYLYIEETRWISNFI